jgi:UrcA family protein
MNTMTKIFVATLAMGAATLATAGNLPDVKVAYSKQELASPALAAGLYARVTSAVKQSCAQLDGAGLARKRSYNYCISTLLAKAVRDVQSPTLAAVHEARTGEHIDVMQVAVRLAGDTPVTGRYTR